MKSFFEKSTVFTVLLFAAIAGILLMMGNFTSGDNSKGINESTAEKKLRELCEMVNGVGKASVAVTFSEDEIIGVGVVCEGGDDPAVIKDLVCLISASCNLPSNRIYIAGAEKNESVQS